MFILPNNLFTRLIIILLSKIYTFKKIFCMQYQLAKTSLLYQLSQTLNLFEKTIKYKSSQTCATYERVKLQVNVRCGSVEWGEARLARICKL